MPCVPKKCPKSENPYFSHVCMYLSMPGRSGMDKYMHTCLKYGFSLLRLFWNQVDIFNQLVLEDYWTDFDNFWCKIKLRVCLFCFCCVQHTFIGTKTTKTFPEIKNVVFFLPSFQKGRLTDLWVPGENPWKIFENLDASRYGQSFHQTT